MATSDSENKRRIHRSRKIDNNHKVSHKESTVRPSSQLVSESQDVPTLSLTLTNITTFNRIGDAWRCTGFDDLIAANYLLST